MPVWPPCSASVSSWAFSSALLLLCVACTPQPKKVVVGRIIIDGPRALDAQHASRENLRKSIGEKLEEDGTVRLALEARDATHILQVVLSESIALPEGGTGRVVEVRLRPTGEGVAEFAASQRATDHTDLGTTALEGFAAAWATLEKLRRLDVAKDTVLIAALTDPDPRVREFAIRRVGDRRLRDAVDPLCKGLETEPEPTLVLRTIGALMAIGDPRAVEPLIAVSLQKDPAFVMQVVFAVGAIGGRTAQAYLVTLASGHPDEEIRRSADDALKELKRRK